ncbi:MAG: luciferase domain-containing protein, partial [Bdellovibrionota bacterium]
MDLARELEARILGLTDVEAKKSRFSPKKAFYRGSKEFAYFHNQTALDLRLTAKQIKTLKPDFRLDKSFGRKDWVIVHFETEEDLDYVYVLAERAWKA